MPNGTRHPAHEDRPGGVAQSALYELVGASVSLEGALVQAGLAQDRSEGAAWNLLATCWDDNGVDDARAGLAILDVAATLRDERKALAFEGLHDLLRGVELRHPGALGCGPRGHRPG